MEQEPEWFDDQQKSLIQDWMVEDKRLLIKMLSSNVKDIWDRRKSSIGLLSRSSEFAAEKRQDETGYDWLRRP